MRVHTAKGGQANGIKITLQNGKQFLIDRKLSDGEFVVLKNNSLYIKFRKKREEIAGGHGLTLPNGQSEMSIAALNEGNEKVKLELVVNTIGIGEKI